MWNKSAKNCYTYVYRLKIILWTSEKKRKLYPDFKKYKGFRILFCHTKHQRQQTITPFEMTFSS